MGEIQNSVPSNYSLDYVSPQGLQGLWAGLEAHNCKIF